MINNIRLQARKIKYQLDKSKSDINQSYFNTSYITEYNDNTTNCSKGE